ncbi:MAG: Asp-tRNA(Asn)/Glu-tRNA(Gln) amidotransferase subunit GatC [Eubacteriales bacterium]|nr:Asp-tRNA(Asn)/Glu-tRNA(Gln) amidotransferase subunit GatC [Eubacteriales bacterium]
MAEMIDDRTMENICILAKLSLTGEEKEKAKADMQKMLDYVNKLEELDTEEVEPMVHIFKEVNVFREDEVTNSDSKEAMLFNAPKEKEGQYQVPKTVG